jgi:hypothetical protein
MAKLSMSFYGFAGTAVLQSASSSVWTDLAALFTDIDIPAQLIVEIRNWGQVDRTRVTACIMLRSAEFLGIKNQRPDPNSLFN